MKILNKSIYATTVKNILKIIGLVVAINLIVFFIQKINPNTKIEVDRIYYISNNLKKEIESYFWKYEKSDYLEDNLIFLFDKYKYKKRLTGFSKVDFEEGKFQYKVKNTNEIIVVFWKIKGENNIIVQKILKK